MTNIQNADLHLDRDAADQQVSAGLNLFTLVQAKNRKIVLAKSDLAVNDYIGLNVIVLS
jgi:hypothetical protein